MGDINGINQFGSLVSKTGKQVSIDEIMKYDRNGNGTLESSELSSALKALELDSVDFKTIDADSNKHIDEMELTLWEQKVKIQELINKKLQEAAADTVLAPKIADIQAGLVELMNEFLNEDHQYISILSVSFEDKLNVKYEELKAGIYANDPTTVQNSVIDELYNEIILKGYSAEEAQAMTKTLEAKAKTYAASYSGENLNADLKTFLSDYIFKSDKERAEDAINTYREVEAGINDGYTSEEDLATLKEAVTAMFQEFIKQGITIRFCGINILSTAAISQALKQYTNAENLKKDINAALDSLSDTTKAEELRNDAVLEAEKQEYEQFKKVTGDKYVINSGLVNLSAVPGINDKIVYTGRHEKERIQDIAREAIEKGKIKEQMEAQIRVVTQDYNIEFDKVKNVFENVYNSSLMQALENITYEKTNHRKINKKKEYTTDQTLKEIIDNFISIFNTNMPLAINTLNASFGDINTEDLNLTKLNQTETVDEKGNVTTSNIKDADGNTPEYDFTKLYEQGKTVTVEKKGADYFVTVAEQILDGLKAQLLQKAQASCRANGVTFDRSAFDNIFDNAKVEALGKGVSGVDSKGSISGKKSTVAIAGSGAVAAGAVGTCTALAISAGAMSAVPVAGWIGAGVCLVAAACFAIFGKGHHSSSTLDTRTLVDTFTETFKENYTKWVNDEKAKKA